MALRVEVIEIEFGGHLKKWLKNTCAKCLAFIKKVHNSVIYLHRWTNIHLCSVILCFSLDDVMVWQISISYTLSDGK